MGETPGQPERPRRPLATVASVVVGIIAVPVAFFGFLGVALATSGGITGSAPDTMSEPVAAAWTVGLAVLAGVGPLGWSLANHSRRGLQATAGIFVLLATFGVYSILYG